MLGICRDEIEMGKFKTPQPKNGRVSFSETDLTFDGISHIEEVKMRVKLIVGKFY